MRTLRPFRIRHRTRSRDKVTGPVRTWQHPQCARVPKLFGVYRSVYDEWELMVLGKVRRRRVAEEGELKDGDLLVVPHHSLLKYSLQASNPEDLRNATHRGVIHGDIEPPTCLFQEEWVSEHVQFRSGSAEFWENEVERERGLVRRI